MDDEEEKRLMDRLEEIHRRVQWMADEESRSVWVKGLPARGIYDKSKAALLDETDRILDKLEGKS